MGWQRFNRTTNIFEVSDDKGASWQPLVIASSGFALPANIAYTNVANTFTARNNFSVAQNFPSMYIIEAGAPANGKKWVINASAQLLQIYAVNDAEDTIIGRTHYFHRDGVLQTGGTLYVGSDSAKGDIYTTLPIYPGRLDTGWTRQNNLYLGSHGSYGLYSNTGLYLAGGFWVAGGVNFSSDVWHNSFDGYNRLYFGSGGATYIKSPGNLIFRDTNSDADVFVIRNGGYLDLSGGVSPGWGYRCKAGVYGAGGGNWFNFNWTGVIDCWIDATHMGYITLGSDARIKRDFTPLENSLNKILQMHPGTYYYKQVKEDAEADPKMYLGLKAQDVLPIAPELVRNTGMKTPHTPDGMFTVDYLLMIPMLVAAIQELNAKVNEKWKN